MITKRNIAALLIAAPIAVLIVRLPAAVAQRAAEAAEWHTLVDVHRLINAAFLGEPDPHTLRQAAIVGMVDALDDPFSEFIPAADVPEFDKAIRGSYVGIGAEVSAEDGFLRIASPMDGSPAYRGGLEADDLIVAVDNRSTYREGLQATIDRLLGQPGTQVTLTVERRGTEQDRPPNAKPPSTPQPAAAERPSTEPESDETDRAENPTTAPATRPGHIRFDITITRERIQAETVKGLHRAGAQWIYFADPERRIAYARLTQFTDDTATRLRDVLRQLDRDGLNALILDVRFNAGGALDAAIDTADLFLEQGRIVSTKGRAEPERVALASPDTALPTGVPVVVLVNAGSASASEILAGALQDNRRAVVLGERTLGKGSVQSIFRLPDNAGQLKLTVQHYYLPSGRPLHRTDHTDSWGVDPNPGFFVPTDNEQELELWRIRRDNEILRAERNLDAQQEARWADPHWILQHLQDPQLAAAVRALRAHLDTGSWTPIAEHEGDHTDAVRLAELRDEQRLRDQLARELRRSESRIAALAAGDHTPARHSDTPIPADAALAGGHLAVHDAQGNLVATLRITGDSLPLWLDGAPVEPAEPHTKTHNHTEPAP